MTTEFNTGAPLAADKPGSIGAGADIYRKLDRRPRGSKTMYAAPLVAVAIVLAGGAAAYMMMKPNSAPRSAAAPAPLAAQTITPPAAPAQPAPDAATPAPAERTPVAEALPVVHRVDPARVAAQSVRSRPRHAAPSALTSGEDANAYTPVTPAAPMTAQPPAATTAQPPAALSASAPVSLPAPPAPPPAQPPS